MTVGSLWSGLYCAVPLLVIALLHTLAAKFVGCEPSTRIGASGSPFAPLVAAGLTAYSVGDNARKRGMLFICSLDCRRACDIVMASECPSLTDARLLPEGGDNDGNAAL